MVQSKKNKKMKRFLDVLLLLGGAMLAFGFYRRIGEYQWIPVILIVLVICMLCALYDLIISFSEKDSSNQALAPEFSQGNGPKQLILLDEQGKPIKAWDLQGRTALIIGKAGQGQELDVDLSDCEYSSFIDFQHAVINFCLDQWYVEDLNSQNGVKVKKVEDGECYRVIHRPCKIATGDVLYIANTKLLLT